MGNLLMTTEWIHRINVIAPASDKAGANLVSWPRILSGAALDVLEEV
jgi:hypothetical protein